MAVGDNPFGDENDGEIPPSNQTKSGRQTALHIAVAQHDVNFVKTMLDISCGGSSANQQTRTRVNFALQNSEAKTPLGLAIMNKDFDIANELLKGMHFLFHV